MALFLYYAINAVCETVKWYQCPGSVSILHWVPVLRRGDPLVHFCFWLMAPLKISSMLFRNGSLVTPYCFLL